MIYLLKLNIAIAIFYIAYRLLFANDTFFRNRRATLMGAIILSAIIPLTDVGLPESMMPKENSVTGIYATKVLPALTVTAGTETAATPDSGADTTRLLLAAYLAVSAMLAARTVWHATTIIRMARRSTRTTVNGIEVRLVEGSNISFSFMKWIFADADTLHSSKAADVLNHERTHAEQWHTADVLLGELMCAACWANPAAWLMRRQMRINLEYLADEHVLALGADTRTYQYHLLALSCPSERNIAISNNFNVLPLKMRIKMMNKKRTAPQKRAKYLLLLPLAAILMAANNAETQAHKLIQPVKVIVAADAKQPLTVVTPEADKTMAQAPTAPQPAQTVAATNDKTADDNDNTVYDTPEVLPEFTDSESGEKGVGALMKYLSRNVKYPLIAMKAGVEGKVVVKFVVNTDGTVSDATIIKSTSKRNGNETAGEPEMKTDNNNNAINDIHVMASKRDDNETTSEPEVKTEDACNALNAEAVRVVNATKWTPGKNKDKPVRVYFTLPINFRLQ